MLKVKRDDIYDLNNEDGGFDLDDVNNLFMKIQNNHENDDSNNDDDEEE